MESSSIELCIKAIILLYFLLFLVICQNLDGGDYIAKINIVIYW